MSDTDKRDELTDQAARKLLGGMPLPNHAMPEPTRESRLEAAMGAAPSRANSLPRRYRMAWLLGIMLTLGLVSVALNMPGLLQRNSSVDPEGQAKLGSVVNPLLAETAWASVEGVVLEYEFVELREILTPEERNARYIAAIKELREQGKSPEDMKIIPILSRVQRATKSLLADISEKYGHLNAPGNPNDIAYLVSHTGMGSLPMSWDSFRYAVASSDPMLLEELKAGFAAIPGVWGPREYSETLYYSEKYPNLCVPGRMVTINGKRMRVPQEFDGDEMHYLLDVLKLEPGTDRYYANLRLRLSPGDDNTVPERFGFGAVCRVSWGEEGELQINTIHSEAEFELPLRYHHITAKGIPENFDPTGPPTEENTKGMIVILPTVFATLPADGAPEGFDPVAALQAEYDKLAPPESNAQDPAFKNYNYHFSLFEEDRMLTRLQEEFSEDERAWSRGIAELAQEVAAEYNLVHGSPEMHARGYKMVRIYPVIVGDELVVALTAQIQTTNPETAAAFKHAIEDATGMSEFVDPYAHLYVNKE